MSERVILMELVDGGKRKITLEEGDTVTFGAVVPGSKYTGAGGWCLRVYGPKKRQKGAFVDVQCFREEAIPVEELKKTTKTRHLGEDAPEGFQHSTVSATVSRWVNPNEEQDDDDNKFATMLTTGDDNF